MKNVQASFPFLLFISFLSFTTYGQNLNSLSLSQLLDLLNGGSLKSFDNVARNIGYTYEKTIPGSGLAVTVYQYSKSDSKYIYLLKYYNFVKKSKNSIEFIFPSKSNPNYFSHIKKQVLTSGFKEKTDNPKEGANSIIFEYIKENQEISIMDKYDSLKKNNTYIVSISGLDNN